MDLQVESKILKQDIKLEGLDPKILWVLTKQVKGIQSQHFLTQKQVPKKMI
jgi:hypothetical protein